MRAEEFSKVLQDVFEAVDGVLGIKADEYAVDGDRLHNFKKAANLQGITQMEALGGMLAKHTVSVFDLIAQETDVPLEKWDEKIIDHINYLILLRAIVVEELEK